MSVMTNSGPAVVKLGGNTIIRGEVPVKFSDLTAGMYVGATAEKLHLFQRPQRFPIDAGGLAHAAV